MRTTLDLDSDVMALLREEAERSRRPFKQVVNQALRLGLAAGQHKTADPFEIQTFDLGPIRPGYDYDKLGQLDDELQAEEFKHEYGRDQRH
jgi:hypothetical protein